MAFFTMFQPTRGMLGNTRLLRGEDIGAQGVGMRGEPHWAGACGGEACGEARLTSYRIMTGRR